MEIPSHIAIIMDGNGRWAQKKGLPRRKGHRAGVDSFESVLRRAASLGVSCLTVYAFSTENWKRPGKEVNFLMHLFQNTLLQQARELFKNDVRVKIIGRREQLSSGIMQTIEEVEEMTSKNKGILLNIAFNYGGRVEIVDMFKKVLREYQDGKDIEYLDEMTMSRYLYNSEYPEVELLIRTGGEKRLSNFLLWQSAYAELYFSDKFWPDFDGDELEKAIDVFQKRDRRFGGLKEMGER
ncbi:MAG: isoprenyl transferase [Halanaerobiales bacterium]